MSSNVGTMIATILAASADVIAHIVGLATSGDEDGARRAVGRFVSATETQLYNDRREAEDVLDARFSGEGD